MAYILVGGLHSGCCGLHSGRRTGFIENRMAGIFVLGLVIVHAITGGYYTLLLTSSISDDN